MNEEVKLKELTPEQEAFCIAYTRDDGFDSDYIYGKYESTFSNATLSYAEAYGFDLASLSDIREKDEKNNDITGTSERDKAINVCASGGSRLLRNEKIIKRKRELLMDLFGDDTVFDARLVEIAKRGKDADAINAIKHRSDLKQRITKKLDITTLGRPFASLSDEELAKIAETGAN